MSNQKQAANFVPPHSADAEKAVLGSVLRNSDNLNAIADFLKPEHFFLNVHQRIMGAMAALYQSNESADVITVAEKLRQLGGIDEEVGPAYLIELVENCPVAQNIDHYAQHVRRYHHLRSIIYACQDTMQKAYSCAGSVEEFVEEVEKQFLAITNENDRKGLVHINEAVESALDEIQKNIERGEAITGVPSGFTDLDMLFGGFQKSDLLILAARPGMGKTSFALNCVCHAARAGKRVAFFTLEMSKEQLVNRLISSEARVDAGKLRKGNLTQDEQDRLMEGARAIWSMNDRIGIDETPGITLLELRSRCRRFQKEAGLDMIVVDYLQLMRSAASRPESREREIAEISMGLKALAKELMVPVMALAQLNRGLEARPDKRPKVSDLRESGSIEQDADIIMFIYRDEKYNPSSEKKGIAEIIIGKNRHGAASTVELAFQGEFVSFHNLMRTPS